MDIDLKEWEARRWWVFCLARGLALQAVEDAGLKLTRRQLEALATFVGRQCERDILNIDKYEVKELAVQFLNPGSRYVYVAVTTGLRGDDGSMAQFLCRPRVTAFIGPRGGLRVMP